VENHVNDVGIRMKRTSI